MSPHDIWRRGPLLLLLVLALLCFGASWLLGLAARWGIYEAMYSPAAFSEVRSAALAAAKGDAAKARALIAVDWPSACDGSAAGTVAWDAPDCVRALNAATPFPDSFKQLVQRLSALRLTGARLAAESVVSETEERSRTLAEFPAGEAAEKARNGRADLARWVKEHRSTQALGPEDLLSLAGAAFALAREQARAATAHQEGVSAHFYGRIARNLSAAAHAMLIVIACLVLAARLRRGSARYPWLWPVVGALLTLTVVAPAALEALARGARTKVGEADFFGAPLVVVGLIGQLIGGFFAALGSPETLGRLLWLSAFAFLFARPSWASLGVAILAPLLLPAWVPALAGERAFAFTVFDPALLDLSLPVTLVTWALEIGAALAAALIACGAWAVLGEPAVALGTRWILALDRSDEWEGGHGRRHDP